MAKSADECTKAISYLHKTIGPATESILKDAEMSRHWMSTLSSELQVLGFTHAEDAKNIQRIVNALVKPGTTGALWIQGAKEGITNLDTLKTSFIGTFCPASSKFDAQAELHTLQWKEGEETLELYFNRYADTIYRAFNKKGEEAEKEHIINWFKGLPSSIIQQLLGQSTELSARQYLEAAKRIYAIQKATTRESSSNSNKTGSINHTGVDEEEPNGYTAADELLSRKMDENTQVVKDVATSIASLTTFLQQTEQNRLQQQQPYNGRGNGPKPRPQQQQFPRDGNYNGGRNGGNNNNRRNQPYNHQNRREEQERTCHGCKSPYHFIANCPYNRSRYPSFHHSHSMAPHYPPTYPYMMPPLNTTHITPQPNIMFQGGMGMTPPLGMYSPLFFPSAPPQNQQVPPHGQQPVGSVSDNNQTGTIIPHQPMQGNGFGAQRHI